MSDSNLPDIVIDISEEEFRTELEAGLAEDEVLHPGRHIFRRGGFLARHSLTPSTATSPERKAVTLVLDSDVLTFFQERSEKPDAPSYQAQINAALREVMLRETA